MLVHSFHWFKKGAEGSPSCQKEAPLPERAVDETPDLLLGCSHCLSHFHCLLNGLQINLDGSNRTRHELHCRTPAHAKIVTIDRRLRGQTCARPHQRALTVVCDVEGNRFGHPMHAQVPSHLIVLTAYMLDVRACKADGGILLHGKEGG